MSRRLKGEFFATIYERFLYSDLSDKAVRLLLILDRCANEGKAYPGRPWLAERLGCSTDTVDRALRDLEKAGAITTGHTPRPGGGRAMATYFLWPAKADEQSRTDAELDPEQSRTGADSKPQGRGPAAEETNSLGNREGNTEETRDARDLPPNRAPLKPGIETTFTACWEHYPRKLNRKGALKAFTATVRRLTGAGQDQDDVLKALKWATHHYATHISSTRTAPEHTMHGATFYGPNERWKDWTDGPPESSGNGARPTGGVPSPQGAARAAVLDRIEEEMRA